MAILYYVGSGDAYEPAVRGRGGSLQEEEIPLHENDQIHRQGRQSQVRQDAQVHCYQVRALSLTFSSLV